MNEENPFFKLIGKKVKIFTNKGRFYQGTLVKIDEKFIHFEDRYDGFKLISIESIDDITEVKNE